MRSASTMCCMRTIEDNLAKWIENPDCMSGNFKASSAMFSHIAFDILEFCSPEAIIVRDIKNKLKELHPDKGGDRFIFEVVYQFRKVVDETIECKNFVRWKKYAARHAVDIRAKRRAEKENGRVTSEEIEENNQKVRHVQTLNQAAARPTMVPVSEAAGANESQTAAAEETAEAGMQTPDAQANEAQIIRTVDATRQRVGQKRSRGSLSRRVKQGNVAAAHEPEPQPVAAAAGGKTTRKRKCPPTKAPETARQTRHKNKSTSAKDKSVLQLRADEIVGILSSSKVTSKNGTHHLLESTAKQYHTATKKLLYEYEGDETDPFVVLKHMTGKVKGIGDHGKKSSAIHLYLRNEDMIRRKVTWGKKW